MFSIKRMNIDPKIVSDYEIGSNTHVPIILFDYTYVLVS